MKIPSRANVARALRVREGDGVYSDGDLTVKGLSCVSGGVPMFEGLSGGGHTVATKKGSSNGSLISLRREMLVHTKATCHRIFPPRPFVSLSRHSSVVWRATDQKLPETVVNMRPCSWTLMVARHA